MQRDASPVTYPTGARQFVMLEMTCNRPVNADARASTVLCMGSWARAGYWERWKS